MKITADYHTHTIFSHGKGTILENAESAKERGLSLIGITDHGFSHPAYCIKRKNLPKMHALAKEAESLTGVKVLIGTESNILGVSGKTDVKPTDYESLDLFLAGIHRFILYDRFSEWFKMLGANTLTKIFGGKPSEILIKRNTEIYINAIKNNPIDILTHVNYLVYANPVEVAKCCRDYGTYFEINARKTHLSDEEWEKVIDTGVNFVIDSDAHVSEKVGNITLVEELFERVKFPLDRIMNIDGKLPPKMRFEEFKKKL